MRLGRGISGVFALALIIACGLPTIAHTQTLGQLAVLRGNPPVVDLRSPATGTTTQTWPAGDTAARGLALRYDGNGVLESVFVAHSVPASVTRIVAATGVADSSGPTYPGATLYDLAVDRDGSVLLAMRTPPDYGCVYRLSADMATTTLIKCLPSGQTPWALALNQDGRILIGWNSAIAEASANSSNGVMFLNPETGVTESLNAVAGSPCPLLSDIAVAPGGRIYVAEYPAYQWSGAGTTISWLDPTTPSTRTLLLSGQGMGWGILVRPAQMAIAGTAAAHTVYVADPWGICGGGGPGMPGMPCPSNGGLVAISSGGGASRVANWWSGGPYGVGFVGSAVTTSPVDTTTGTTPVTLAFDGISSTGSTSLVTSTDGFAPPSGFQLGDPATYYEITTEVGFTGGITVCVNYTGVSYADETQLKLNHWTGSVWEELPNQTLDTAANIVCGRTMSLSPFAIFEPYVPLVSVTVKASPANCSFTVDGTTYTTSQTFSWVMGSSHTIATSSPQAGTAGTKYTFANWSDAGAISHTITVPATPATYTASFTTQYQLTTAVNPAGTGVVSPVSGAWYPAGTVVTVKAFPNTGYSFVSWSGPVANNTSVTTTVTMTGPQSITANQAGNPVLSAAISGKSGTTPRTWNITVSNSGQSTAHDARITGLALTQTYGTACTPVIAPAQFPVLLGEIAVGGSAIGLVTINFTGCAATARFTATISYSANSGAASGSKSYGNQFQ